MISRERAHEIAAAFLRDRRAPADWEGVDRVLSPAELAAEMPPALRPALSVDPRWASSWIAYVRLTPGARRSGAVVLIAQADGAVLFAGSVRDGG